jgi:hypothetical protein
MSIRLMACVWDMNDPELNNSRLLLLLALADHANDEGICYPSIPRLAQRARISERQAQRTIQWLAAAGYIEIIAKGTGRGHSTLYHLTLNGDILSPNGNGKDDILSPDPAPKGDILSPNPASKGDILSPNDSTKGDKMSPNRGKKQPTPDKMSPNEARKGDIAMSRARVGWLVGYDPFPDHELKNQPTNQPTNAGVCARARGFLLDDDVGMPADWIDELPAITFRRVVQITFDWLHDYRKGEVKIGALRHRLKQKGGAPPLRDEDRQSEICRRHVPEAYRPPDIEKNYLPAEYADIIIG